MKTHPSVPFSSKEPRIWENCLSAANDRRKYQTLHQLELGPEMQSIPVPSVAGLGPMVHSAMSISLTDGQKVSVTYQKKQKNCSPKVANHNYHSHGVFHQKCRTCNQKQAAAQKQRTFWCQIWQIDRRRTWTAPGTQHPAQAGGAFQYCHSTLQVFQVHGEHWQHSRTVSWYCKIPLSQKPNLQFFD